MTRGSSSAATNKSLREQLSLAREARANLERRVEAAEKKVARVEAWKAEARRKGMPEVLAERKRAEDALAREMVAVQEETDRWVGFAAQAWPMVLKILTFIPDDTAFIDADGLQGLVEIFGEDASRAIGIDRASRRVMLRAAYAKKRLVHGEALKAQGHREN